MLRKKGKKSNHPFPAPLLTINLTNLSTSLFCVSLFPFKRVPSLIKISCSNISCLIIIVFFAVFIVEADLKTNENVFWKKVFQNHDVQIFIKCRIILLKKKLKFFFFHFELGNNLQLNLSRARNYARKFSV